jgi:4-hydroxy-tetrahydrodipicolinate synthase
MKLEGTFTALVTPFRDDESIDWAAFDALVDAQIDGGVDGLVPCGTTGESPTLSPEEQAQLISRTVKRAAGRVKIIAGTGSNATKKAVLAAQAAEAAGADAVMSVVPYYNRPTQDGLLAHFSAVASAVKVPVVVYNIPGRTGTDLASDTLVRLCEGAPNVVATKEATGTVLRAQELVRRLGPRLTVLSGDDVLTLAMIAVGARGVISVTSNLLPAEVSRATRLALDANVQGRIDEARRAHLALLPVHEAMFLESNPSPVKAALALRGAMKPLVRAPLVPATQATTRKIAALLEARP